MFTYAAYRRYRRRRRRRRIAYLTAVALLVAIAVQHAAQAHRPTPAQPVRAASSPSSTALAARVLTGRGVRWLDFHGIELPVSATAGPHYLHNGLSRGFTGTPAGAVLAAVNIVVRTAAQWGPGIYRPTILRQVTGPAARTLLANDRGGYRALRAAAHVAPGQPAGRGYALEAAYRLDRYTPLSAAVEIVSEGPASNGTAVRAVTRIQLRWLRGDWRVLAPPGGSWANSSTPVFSLSGYTAFPSEG
ncbi:MAG: hypothetical protein ACHP9Z_21135 [Streptosporangiales bacterium]